MWAGLWNVVKKKEPEVPKICDLCGKPIEEDDYYYIGYTHYDSKVKIWASTCTDFKCTQWLIAKTKERKLT